ncbi:MAG: hypothetical protein M1838_005942 [Thelocarpon superellum]|nr:MAG: hypothetical protein M1838_005942 [Thelocarpon superellum]
MSLNGLEDPQITDAFQAALAEPGGWFVLKYATRDGVELLARGSGGVADLREAVSSYPEQSPLYGFLKFRRRSVLLKYVPNGTSRLLQARVAVHFQSIAENFSPHDAVFNIASANDLKDTALSAACSLHAASHSTSSSNSSLPRPRLGEIAEDAEETRTVQGEIEKPLPPLPDGPAPTFPHREASVRSKAEMRSSEDTERAIRDAVLSATSPATELDRAFASSATPIAPFLDHRPSTSSNAPPPPSNEIEDRRMSSSSMRPSTRELANAYPYGLKPKVKLGPRPSLDHGGRPDSSLHGVRPVSALPAGLRVAPRKLSGPKTKPHHPAAAMPTIDSALLPPLLRRDIPLSPTLEIPRPTTSSSVAGGPAPSVHSVVFRPAPMSPSKQKLMKALQLRKKQMEASTKTAPQESDEKGVGEPQGSEAQDGGLVSPVSQVTADLPSSPEETTGHGAPPTKLAAPATEPLSLAPSTEHGPSEEIAMDKTGSSPVSLAESHDPVSTKASSVSENTDHHQSMSTERAQNDVGEMESSTSPQQEVPPVSSQVEEMADHPDGENEPKLDSSGPGEVPTAQTGAGKTTAEELPVDESATEKTPADHTPINDMPAEKALVGKTPTKASFEETPIEATPVEETPIKETPVVETSVDDAAVIDVHDDEIKHAVPHQDEEDDHSSIVDESAAYLNGNAEIEESLDEEVPPAHVERSAEHGTAAAADHFGDGTFLDTGNTTDADADSRTSKDGMDESDFLGPATPSTSAVPATPATPTTPIASIVNGRKDGQVTPAPRVEDVARTSLHLSRASDSTGGSGSKRASVEESTSPQKKRRGLVDPIRTDIDPDTSDDNLLSDKSLMNELRAATVEEARPVSVRKSPMNSAFPRRPNEAWMANWAASNPSVPMATSITNGSSAVEVRADGRERSTSGSLLAVNGHKQGPIAMIKKINVSSGISQRIKALEMLSSQANGGPVTPPPDATPSPQSSPAFSSLRNSTRRSPSLRQGTTPTQPKKGISFNPFSSKRTAPVEPPCREEPTSKPADHDDMPNGNASEVPTESISVKARILKDVNQPYAADAEAILDPNDPTPLDLQASPLVIEHHRAVAAPQRSRVHSSKNERPLSTISSSMAQRSAPTSPTSTRRASNASKHSSSSVGRAEKSPPPGSRISSSSGGASAEDKKEQRKESTKSRIFRRMSSISGGSRKSVVHAVSPTVREEEMADPVAGSAQRRRTSIEVGEVNVQFPDSLLWKRRCLKIDSHGYLTMTQSKADELARASAKRYHLGEFNPPYAPDQDGQELPHSVILDLRDGGTLQCACEHPAGQAHVLKKLAEAHGAWVS